MDNVLTGKKSHPDIRKHQDGYIFISNIEYYRLTFTTGEKIMSSTPWIFNPIRAKT